ncbi:MAG: UPF0164 family protein [bacterium]|nr:UPF0164 family protein [bacterium]
MWRVIFSLILISNMSEASFESRALSVRAEGMGGAFTALADDAGAIFYNPAGLAQITLQEVTCLRTHPFDMSELEQNLITYLQPTQKGGRGFSYLQFTDSDSYKETQLLFSASTFISKNLCLGVSLKQMGLKIDGYGDTSKFGIDAGGLYEISPKIKIGIVGFNLNHPLDTEKSYNVGLCIRPILNLLITIDVEKTERFNSEIKFGQEIWITNNLCLRVGLKKHTLTQPTLGLGILTGTSEFDYSCVFHPDLGATHLYSFTKWF